MSAFPPAHSAQPRAAQSRRRRPSASEARTAKVAANAANDVPRARVQRPARAMMIPEHGCMSLKRYKGLSREWLNRRPEPGFRLRKAVRMLFVIFCIHKATLYILPKLECTPSPVFRDGTVYAQYRP